jgi:hypothetical protein
MDDRKLWLSLATKSDSGMMVFMPMLTLLSHIGVMYQNIILILKMYY